MDFKFAFASFYVIVFILFPGIIIKRSYFRGEFSKQFNQGDFSDRLITTFFWGFVSQIIILYLFNIAVDPTVDLSFISKISSDLLKEQPSFEILQNLDKNDIKSILVYFVFLIFVPFLIGYIAYKAVRIFGLDTKSSALRFSNYWYYYYSGDILKRNEFSHIKATNDLGKNGIEEVLCDVLIKVSEGKTSLYSGKFSQYTICKTSNKLENIFLTNVERFSSSEKRFKKIKSDIMQIPCENLVNLNIRYIAKKQSKLFRIKNNALTIIFILLFSSSLLLPWIMLSNNSIIKNLFICLTSTSITVFLMALLASTMFKEIKVENKGNFYSFLISIILILLIILLKLTNN